MSHSMLMSGMSAHCANSRRTRFALPYTQSTGSPYIRIEMPCPMRESVRATSEMRSVEYATSSPSSAGL